MDITRGPQEDALVGQARRGSRAAFAELYQRYARMVHGILLARVPPSEVDDLMQNVFMAALQRIDSLRTDDAFGGWVATIARNQSIDYYRRTPKVTEIHEGHLRQRPPSPEVFAVMDAIRSLPDAYRETLSLRLVEGLTGPEIAAQTGLTADSVRVNLHRGMKMLRDKLEGKAAHE
jgi:RNA polymerase sigma-70 factor, ECF subfamily